MNKKVCGKCGNYYDENLNDCPLCGSSSNNSDFNVQNMFLELEKNDEKKENIEVPVNNTFIDNSVINNNIDNNVNIFNKEPIIEEPKKETISEEVIEKKIEIINKKNNSLKKKKNAKKGNPYYSYFLLILGMILLFIIIFSTISKFDLPIFCHYTLTAFTLMIAFSLSYRGKPSGYYLAVLSSLSMIFMLFESDYTSFVIGIYLFIYSFAYLIKNK